MTTPKTDNSNERESAAQMFETTEAIVGARRELYVAMSAINKALELARKDCNAAQGLGADEWLKALKPAENVLRAREEIENAIGWLNRASGTWGKKNV